MVCLYKATKPDSLGYLELDSLDTFDDEVSELGRGGRPRWFRCHLRSRRWAGRPSPCMATTNVNVRRISTGKLTMATASLLNGTLSHSITLFLSLARCESAGDRGSRDKLVQGSVDRVRQAYFQCAQHICSTLGPSPKAQRGNSVH